MKDFLQRKIIDFEAHAQSQEYVKELFKYNGFPRYASDDQGRFTWYQSPNTFEVRNNLQPKLDDVRMRLQDMDEEGVDIQAVSPSIPNCEAFPKEMGIRLAKLNNDYIANLVSQYPDRFVGLGSLPLQDTEASLEELDRMKSIGLVGVMSVSNVQKEHIDAEKYWPIFERVERLRFPFFIHPNVPVNAEMYSQYHLWGPAFGFGADVALCSLRMINGGVFEKYPQLKVVIGHLGETLPFIIKRIDFVYVRTPEALPSIKRKPSEYFLTNFYVDTAGNFHEPSLQCARETLGSDKIVFGSDYPLEKLGPGVEFVERSSLSEEDKDMIYCKNAAKLLGLG